MKPLKYLPASLVALLALSSLSQAAGVQFQSYDTHSHLVLSSDVASQYVLDVLKDDGKMVGLSIQLPALDSQTLAGVAKDLNQGFKDVRTQAVQVVGNSIQIRLSPGAAASGVDYFDYRSRTNGEVSIDYWAKGPVQTPEALAEQERKKKSAELEAKRKKVSKVAKFAKPGKAIRGETPVAECSHKLDLPKDGYVYWKIYHRAFPYAKYFNLDTADADYKYPYMEKSAADSKFPSKELAHYRLALKLSKEAKLGLVLRTIAFFDDAYPKSELKKELDFLRAATFVRLAKILHSAKYFEEAKDLYRSIYFEDASTERGRRALAYLVQIHMDSGDYMQALEYALIGAEPANTESALDKTKASLEKNTLTPWVYRLATAETLFLLGEYDRAERSYQLLIDADNAVTPEASFRIGEVYAARNFWERAILSFEKAQKAYPKLVSKYPTALFNYAEAYFRIGKLSDAERLYKQFMTLFPNDDSTWAAELRLVEMRQMQLPSGDVKAALAVRKAYDAVVNRYPYSAGEILAQLRLCDCAGTMSESDARKEYFQSLFKNRDLKSLQDELVDSIEAERWFDLAESRFGLRNGDYELALLNADKYRGKFQSIPLGESFHKTFSDSAAAAVIGYAERKDYKNAYDTSAHYGDLVASPQPVNYLVALVETDMQLGKLDGAVQALSELGRRTNEMSPNTRDAYHSLAAKQEWLLSQNRSKALAHLKEISDSGPYAHYKFQQMALIQYEANQWADVVSSVAHVVESPLKNKLSIGEQMELESRRIDALWHLNDYTTVVKDTDNFELRYGVYTENLKDLDRARDLRALALYESKDYAAAVRAFSDILSKDDKNPRRAEFEFKRARSLAGIGREDEAKANFRKLAQDKDSAGVWGKSAQTELDQLQWENDIKNKTKDRRSLQ